MDRGISPISSTTFEKLPNLFHYSWMKKLFLITTLYLFSSISWSQECVEGDCQDGSGVYEWADGSRYISQFKNGNPYGEAKIIMANGDEVVGEWIEDHFYSHGEKTYSDGKYIGDFKDNNRHGQGTYTWFDGNKYIGAWKDDKRDGLGICMGKNPIMHIPCEWKDGIPARNNFD